MKPESTNRTYLKSEGIKLMRVANFPFRNFVQLVDQKRTEMMMQSAVKLIKYIFQYSLTRGVGSEAAAYPTHGWEATHQSRKLELFLYLCYRAEDDGLAVSPPFKFLMG